MTWYLSFYWPHVALIPVAALGAYRSKGIAQVAGVVVVVGVAASGLYALQHQLLLGQHAAWFVAGLVPFAAAGGAAFMAASRVNRRVWSLAVGIVAGAVAMSVVPYLQLGLGCVFTQVCP